MDDYERGALMAISLIVRMHDVPVVAADVLNGMGLTTIDCSDLDEFDRAPLRKVQGMLGGHIKLRGLRKPAKRATPPEPPR